jgi:hypothetical protein
MLNQLIHETKVGSLLDPKGLKAASGYPRAELIRESTSVAISLRMAKVAGQLAAWRTVSATFISQNLQS